MANKTKYFKTPFAESGTRTEVPNTSVGGLVAFNTGFGPDYELPQGAAGRKRIERDKYNGMLFDVTNNLKQWQEGLYPTWIEDDGDGASYSYPQGMIVNHAGEDWYSNEAANQEEPGTGSKWTIYATALANFPKPATSITRDGSTVDADLFKIENRYFTLQYFGGDDDGATDNVAAINAAKSAGVKAINMNVLKNGVYYFATNTTTLFDDIILICEDGVTISLPQTDNYELVDKIESQGNVTIYDRNINRSYLSNGDNLKSLAMPLSNKQRDAVPISSPQLYQATGVIGSDTLATQSFTDTDGYQLTMPSLAANAFAVVAYPCEINERIGFNWSDESYTKGICVITSNEMYLVYSSSAGSNLNLYYKKSGSTAVTGTVSKPVSSYSLERSQCSVQRTSSNVCRVISNSVAMTGIIPEIIMESDILFVGSVYVSTGTGESVNVKNFYRESAGNISNATLGVSLYGDSLTDNYANNWPDLTKAILQSNGQSITIDNNAVAGENSTQQLARFVSNGLGDSRYYGFLLGTNDVQGSLSLATTLNNLDSFYTTVNNASRKMFVGIPPVWMTQAMGGGTGYTTSNYDKAADYRGSIIRYCLDRGIEYFEMSSTQSYVSDINNAFVRDNIHQTDIGYASTAVAAANAIMNMIKPSKFIRSYRSLTPLGSVTLFSGLEAKVCLNKEKDKAEFVGLFDIDGLTIADGDQVFQIESRYIPQKDKYINVTTSYGESAHIRIDSSNGIVSAYNFGTIPSSAWFSVESISYSLFD
ncbi:hypothetical protein MAELSTROM_48 [Pseudoalteromonas phage Maelstrom]|uniref:hypothetical protein n=1 Tax=Pseudoalteromonas phage Maelstrom TaxID=2065202 RepID=UPI000CA3B646|nr:hypothetical protein PP584_gp48 [Pseudoalteromonas phage Maelstrom]AUG84967.1 hypothetical protein MAELSTROM_48 [Pseudoalteromonas phage Maelstrom]